MTSAQYTIICYVAAVFCVISLLASVFIFIKLNIVGVIGDLSGSNARKGIENIRKQNHEIGNKAYKTSHVNKERGKLTDKITISGKLKTPGERVDVCVGTEKFHTREIVADVITDSTTVLGTQETVVLSDNPSNETTVLAQAAVNETTVLSNCISGAVNVLAESRNNTELTRFGILIEEEIVFVHSTERIE
ncbi:MAG: hypothetical protein IJD49_06535 [Clostridia bacterium]|nr:hypothetical protein [Clostridia bacterium]